MDRADEEKAADEEEAKLMYMLLYVFCCDVVRRACSGVPAIYRLERHPQKPRIARMSLTDMACPVDPWPFIRPVDP